MLHVLAPDFLDPHRIALSIKVRQSAVNPEAVVANLICPDLISSPAEIDHHDILEVIVEAAKILCTRKQMLEHLRLRYLSLWTKHFLKLIYY